MGNLGNAVEHAFGRFPALLGSEENHCRARLSRSRRSAVAELLLNADLALGQELGDARAGLAVAEQGRPLIAAMRNLPPDGSFDLVAV